HVSFETQIVSKIVQIWLYGNLVVTGWLLYYVMHLNIRDKRITKLVWWKFICVATFNLAVMTAIAVLAWHIFVSLVGLFIPPTSVPKADDLLAIPALVIYVVTLAYYIPA